MDSERNSSASAMEPIHINVALSAGNNQSIIGQARGHEILMDTRKEWGGDDAGTNPPECMAIALGGCIFNICRIMAAEKQLDLRGLSLSVAGSIDPTRAFGMNSDNRAGFLQFAVKVRFPAEIPAEEKNDFYQELLKRCPLCDTIANPTLLEIAFE